MLKNYTCHGVVDKRSRKELKVRQKSYGLCLGIYRITPKFPMEERYGLTSQIKRSVVSISSNIAEEMEERQPWITLENKPLNP